MPTIQPLTDLSVYSTEELLDEANRRIIICFDQLRAIRDELDLDELRQIVSMLRGLDGHWTGQINLDDLESVHIVDLLHMLSGIARNHGIDLLGRCGLCDEEGLRCDDPNGWPVRCLHGRDGI